ncbi:MAG: serine hydrolase [Planctomycetes bacterium]|nr:serine hydrolase [Planctomycetota bacterium]
MIRIRNVVSFSISLLFALAGPAAAQQDPQPTLPGVTAAFDKAVSAIGADDAGLAVVRDDEVLHRQLHGKSALDTEMPIASASKWLAVAMVLRLVDDGLLDLDVPVARYVEEFDRDDKRRITLRQCLANTSGLPSRLNDRMRGWDMQRFAEEAADVGLIGQANNEFRYGGVGFQVAAVAAERVTGKTWHQLFADRIAAPLQMTHTSFGTLLPLGGQPGKASLPWVAGGAVSTLEDYSHFVQMLLGKGVWRGHRVLSEAAVADMLRDQVRPQIVVHLATLEGNYRYGLGTWIEQLDGGRVRHSDPGALGFTPWLDLDVGVGGVFAIEDRGPRVRRHIDDLFDAVYASVAVDAVAASTETVELKFGGRNRRYHLHVPPHHKGEALPLLVVLHGGGGNGEQVRENTRIDEIALQKGFVVAFPDGTGRLPKKLLTWNSGGIDVYASQHQIDDVGFLKAVVADVQQHAPIDAGRVFAAGHSNGGMMCHRLAREAADVFAGIAVVEGAMNFTEADSTWPIAVMIVHGTADQHVLYRGGKTEKALLTGGDRVDASVQQAIDYYVARNGVLGYPETDVDGKVRIDTYKKPKADGVTAPVRVVTLDGGGHAWPGADRRTSLLADEPFPWSASKAIVEFFAALQPPKRGDDDEAKKDQQPPSTPR